MGGCTGHQGVVILRPLAGRCLLTRSLSKGLVRCSHDPIAFAQLKADAPSEWSFSSLGEGEEIDAADWWKMHS
jgi:hypothetical protein